MAAGKALPGTTGSPGAPWSRPRSAAAVSSSTAAGRSRSRPWTPSTTRLLDVPSATPTGRPVTAATEAAPRAMPCGSRTETATGPAVSAIRRVSAPTAAASTNASQVGPSPNHTSG